VHSQLCTGSGNNYILRKTHSRGKAVHKREIITSPEDNIQVNLIWRSNKIEASQPKERKLPQQLKPTQRKSDPLKLHLFGYDKWHDTNGITLRRKAVAPNWWQERWSTAFEQHLSSPANSNSERIKLKSEGNDNL